MKTYALSVIAKKLHVWHYTAEKYLTANGVKPIYTKEFPGFGTYKTYAASDVDPVMKKFKLERAQKEAAKLQKEAAKAKRRAAKAEPKVKTKPTRNAVVVKVKDSSNDPIIGTLMALTGCIVALTKAVQENTQTIKDNGWVALDKATRPEKRMN